MKRKRNLTKKFKVGGRIVECTTVQGLANIIGKSKDTVLRYEELGVFGNAPLTYGGVRYYPLSLCERLKPLVAQFKSNRPPDAPLQTQVNVVFNEERQKLYAS